MTVGVYESTVIYYIRRMLNTNGLISTVKVLLVKKVPDLNYKGIIFPIRESEWADPALRMTVHRISIEIPDRLNIKAPGLTLAYMDNSFGRLDTPERKQACEKLARTFVEDILPQVDFELNIQQHNAYVERILSALD